MPFENPTVNWNNIRPHNGSQNSGFEELVCQLARSEDFNDATFTRVGTPDGGVEAYWTFSNGSEYGWQAKYFTAWSNSQWEQIKASFEHSLKTHPQLKCYYICTPLDRPDARRPRVKSAMQRWQELELDAKNKGVELVYWGNSELVGLLLQEANQGLRYYWFNERVLSVQWFAEHIERSVKNLGARYTPEINIDLPILQQFDIIRRNQNCYMRHSENYKCFTREIRDRLKYLSAPNKFINQEELWRLHNELKDLFVVSVGAVIDITTVKEKLKNINTWIDRYITQFEEYKNNEIPNEKLNQEQIESNLTHLKDIRQAFYELQETISFQYLSLFNNGSTVLCGEAGAGKSHLLASVAEQCIKDGIPCILLLGQHFSNHSSPWLQILKSHLGLNCDTHTFLQILNNFGKNYNQRILFMVDAINEGAGIQFWPHYLSGFINDFKEYKYISLVISVRSSYVDYFRESIGDALCYVKHNGFSDDESYDAQEIFFNHYGLQHPKVPLLNPEFNNPLFLKLFCEGLHKAGLSSIPKGMRGFFTIFDFFLEHSAKSIYQRHQQMSPSARIIPKIIEAIVCHFIKNDLHYIDYSEAAEIIASVTSRYGISLGTQILEELISEGIFAKDIAWNSENNSNIIEVLRFSYERLENIEKAKQLLKDVKKEELKQLFTTDGKLYFCHYDLAMLDTLAILIPEKYQCELYSVFPEEDIDQNIASSFLQSLLWRSWDTISKESSKEFINSCVLRFGYTEIQFIETLYMVAAEEGHPFNAEILHSWLSKYNMAKRDSFWTTTISKIYYSDTPISRFITWCYNYGSRMIDGEKSTLLAATALSWLFSATHNSLRNNATAALTKLLINHHETAIDLLEKFSAVDDPYIHERIWAAVYGAVLNSSTKSNLQQLAQWVVDHFFSTEEVYPNVLVRDYARNIVEYICHMKCFTLDDHSIIEPPYNSSFPDKLPDDDYVKRLDLPYDTPGLPKNYEAQRAIIHSMITEYGHGIGGYGDFGRYVFQGKLDLWDRFEIQDLSNYAISLIFDKYGYDIKLHGEFDAKEVDYDRQRKLTERIGKKYQWIAMYEVAARLADNFPVIVEETRFTDVQYDFYSGPWEPNFRDIDPTYTWDNNIPKLPENQIFIYNAWNEDAMTWIKNSSDIPAFSKFLEYKDSANQQWIFLTGNLSWQKEFMIDDGKDELHQRLVGIVASCFAKASEFEILKCEIKLKCSGYEFVDMHDEYKIYLHEYFWAPAYKFFENSPYYSSEHWREINGWRDKHDKFPKVMLTSSSYLWESPYKDSVSHKIPCKGLADFFKLSPGINCGEWISEEKEIVCKEIRVNDSAKPLFFIRKDKLLEFLTDQHLVLVWSCHAEKNSNNSDYRNTHRPLEFAESYALISGIITKIC